MEREGSGLIERSFGTARNAGIVVAILGLIANPTLFLWGSGVGVAGEIGRRNRQKARKNK